MERRRPRRSPRQSRAGRPRGAGGCRAADDVHLGRPRPHPILVVVGEDKKHYDPVWPPTITIYKATAIEERHQTITWGAVQLGIAQGVLDSVAEGLLHATRQVLVFVAIYIDPGAGDETAVRIASREATLKGIRMAVRGRDPDAAQALVDRRDRVSSPFYGGGWGVRSGS